MEVLKGRREDDVMRRVEFEWWELVWQADAACTTAVPEEVVEDDTGTYAMPGNTVV